MNRRVLRTQPVKSPESQSQSGLNRFPLKLVLLLAAAILVSALVTNGSVEAEMLFQSPASPVDGAAEPPPPPQPPQPPPPTPEPIPAEPPPPEPVQTAPTLPPPEPIEQPPAQPVAPQPQQAQPGAPQPVSPLATAAPGVAQPAEPLPPPLPEPTRASRQSSFSEPAAKSDGQSLILDQAELIDTVVVSTAYIWLCCGIIIILLIPLIFLFLQIRGRSKINKLNQF